MFPYFQEPVIRAQGSCISLVNILASSCLIRLRANNKIVGNFSSNSSTNHLTTCLEKQTNMLIYWKNWEQPKLISFSKHNLPQTYLHYSFYLHFYFIFSTSSFHNISLSLSLSLSLITNGEKKARKSLPFKSRSHTPPHLLHHHLFSSLPLRTCNLVTYMGQIGVLHLFLFHFLVLF